MSYNKIKESLGDKLPANFENIAMHEFGKFDKNGNGYIEGTELIELLKNVALHFGFDPSEVETNDFLRKSLLSEIDVNGDKKVTYDEFKIFYLMAYSKSHYLDF